MYGYIGGITDTDEINNCPFCGEEVSISHVDGTVTCDSCERRFGVVETDPEEQRYRKEPASGRGDVYTGFLKKMVNAEETKRFKAKQLRYKKPIVKNLNLEVIQQDLWDIQEECENVRWYTDSEDGEDSLINALDGDTGFI